MLKLEKDQQTYIQTIEKSHTNIKTPGAILRTYNGNNGNGQI